MDSLIKQLKDNAIGLGLIGAGTLMSAGQKSQLPNEQQLQAMGTEAQGVARQLIQQYQSGNLSPGQQASLDQLAQNTKNQLKQYFANIGQSDSTAAVQALAQVDQTVLGMKQQMLDSALDQGLRAIGVAQGPLTTIAQYQLGQDQQLRQAFGNFATGVGTLFGRSAGTPIPTGTVVTPQAPQTSVTAAPVISSVQ